MGYEEELAYLYGLERFGVKLGLDNVRDLLDRLGNPHRAFAVVHVAGSKGKGSVCAFLDAVLRAAGHRVGLYTSPHLVRFNERIRVDGDPISDEEVVRLTGTLRPEAEALAARGKAHQPTFFEFTTALAFRYFRERAVDIAVVEVGMGGRLDATNVVSPAVGVITRVELEHTEYLGRTVARIAKEKAGIVKEGVPVWTVDQGALPVIEERCRALDAPLHVVGRDLRVARTPMGLEGQRVRIGNGETVELDVQLLGTYQAENAALAYGVLRTLQEQGWSVGRRALRRGFAEAQWPARLDVVHRAPTTVVDATHTPEGARRLRASLDELFPNRPLVVVAGVLGDKDVAGILEPLQDACRLLVATSPDSKRAAPAEEVAQAAPGPNVMRAVPVAAAVETALAAAAPEDVVLITGSVYTAGEALVAVDRWKRRRTREVLRRLKKRYLPGAFAEAELETALGRITRATEDPFVVLVSTVLSQRTADPTTEAVSDALFERYPTAEALAQAPVEAIEAVIRPANFYRTKAEAIQEIARRVVHDHGGEVPRDLETLLELPRVGRKTANCVLVYGFGEPAIPVDVHCHRIPNRIGLIHTRDPRATEEALEDLVPQELWLQVNELFVRHGQTTCTPRNPDCASCNLTDLCSYYRRREAGLV